MPTNLPFPGNFIAEAGQISKNGKKFSILYKTVKRSIATFVLW
jgi:hypothetical protein